MSLKEKLRHCELTIGSWLMLGDISAVEILKHAGFEWLVIDLEHTDIDFTRAKHLISAIQANGMQALVRVSKNEEVVIKRILDFGADGIIVPMVCSKADAEQAVSLATYPPKGTRGVGLFRAQQYGLNFKEYQKWVDEELVIIAQIEHINAANNIKDIISVEGIDGAIIGPYDMSASMGVPGEYDREDVQSAITSVFDACKTMNKSVGFHVVETDPSVLLKRISQGCNLLAYSIDYFFMRDKAMECMQQVKAGIK
ncbi:HpcH/HpaI aldolase family protein [Gilvimarinus sp. 1_MG-2023]|uniref:HpcH/HpaI aldolase family protein n=1 Tax=Gilvimarinus sp. 1_MG-2023 TaxID=3062638 RepID=UPI0026E23F55|nr:aldolase/citrate lyase family protein [Gilvimarinus sp. 1_MG-2023]MDO6746296.1 aldolase/citrate lyase family protein [Gilvimarinus sp. 1_MG-2023]